ncbi:MAG: ABC transporter ATP-binding protein [Calditrichota bacterium]
MKETLRYLAPYIARYKWKYIAGVVFLLCTNFFRISNPRVVQYAIDYLKSEFSINTLALLAGLIILIAIFEGIFLFLMRKSMIVASREIENDIRNDFFEKLLTLPPSFYQKMPTGDVMSRATNDLNAVRSVLGPGIAYSTNTSLAFLFVIPMMLLISPRLTMFALLPFPIIIILVNRFGKAIYTRFARIQDQLSVLSTRAQENLGGSTIIKWFAREDFEIEQFRKDNHEYMTRNIDYAKVDAAFRPSLMLTIGCSTAMILLVGGQLIINGTISIGEFAAFLLYMNILVFPSIALGWVIGLFQQGSAALKRMRVVLEAESDIRITSPENPDSITGHIRFKDLNFSYEEQEVLKSVNLEIKPRTTLGIIGHTGSGKSTLIKLIPHFYKLPEKQLFIDGIDINHLPLKTLRNEIGYVPQETFLFSDTIHHNIAYGRADATREEVEKAARLAHIHDEISNFPDGYDAVLGEKGLNLSGGQKQRVSIARALLRDPHILILDDAFSALDTFTEEQILQNLRSYMPDRTVILVSHRVSTLQNCDRIIVMEDGTISQQGTHGELIALPGLYATIHQKQLLEEELASAE